MENNIRKCSNKEHEKIDAVYFCSECKIYMCNKCENFHNKLFQNHTCHKLDKDLNEINLEICQLKGHNNNPFEFFCKTHNQLCCVSCICKIEVKGKGLHKDCDICILEDIKEEKKNALKGSIQNLENLSINLEETINKIKIIFDNMNQKKEELKLEILNIFTKIRNILNERENELLLEIDNKYELSQFNEKIIKDSEKLPNKVKKLIENGKKLENELENNKNININAIIINSLNIEETIKKINFLNDNVNNNENPKQIELEYKYEDDFDIIKKKIQNFGIIISKNALIIKLTNSSIIKDNNLFIYGLNDWKKDTKTELLYKKSRDGNSYNTFHQLCDNKGPTITLIKSSEGFVIGGYTPLDWNNHSGWKTDNETFLFSITNKKIFKKGKKDTNSIYCGEDVGPWFPFIGPRDSGKKDMTQGEFLYKNKVSEQYFENINEIIPHNNKDRFFNIDEVEVYKIKSNH